jgi:hypothetical protein
MKRSTAHGLRITVAKADGGNCDQSGGVNLAAWPGALANARATAVFRLGCIS